MAAKETTKEPTLRDNQGMIFPLRKTVSRAIPIGGSVVETRIKEFEHICSLQVEAGTTGFRGGDWGHGSRAYIRLKNIDNFEMKVTTNDKGDEVEISIGGDCELSQTQEALEFISLQLS